MNKEQYIKNLSVPYGKIDVILDTDAYNEIDDQFAISYMLKCPDKFNVIGITAAPFYLPNKADNVADGMEKSYKEILKLLALADMQELNEKVLRGSTDYLKNETTPQSSEAADFIIESAKHYSPEKPLYVIAIGAITNVASAIIKAPEIAENIVIVWLGGHAHHMPDTYEFNMYQDVAASRVVMSSGVPFVQLPCMGVVSAFTVSGPELEYWLRGKNDLADYLARNTIAEAESYAKGRAWTRVIWDVTAVAWLMNDNNRFMASRLEHTYLSTYDNLYAVNDNSHLMRYVYHINRDALLNDLIARLTK